NGVGIGHVEFIEHLCRSRRQRRRHILKRRAPPSREAHPRAGKCQGTRDGRANPATRAGDQRMMPPKRTGAHRTTVAAARAKLASYCAFADAYCFGHWTALKPTLAASCSVQAGSARCGRAIAHRSARPAARIELAWSASEIAPTAIVP